MPIVIMLTVIGLSVVAPFPVSFNTPSRHNGRTANLCDKREKKEHFKGHLHVRFQTCDFEIWCDLMKKKLILISKTLPI